MKKWMCVLFFVTACGTSDLPKDLDPFINFAEEDGSSNLPDVGTADTQISDSSQPDFGEPDEAPDLPPVDILDSLQSAPSVAAVTELSSQDGFRRFSLRFTQDLDHFEDGSPTFVQDAILFHRDESLPMVLVTTGYGLGEPDQYRGFYTEPTEMVGGNQIILGHRFFEGAIPAPDDQDWSKVNIEQAAADNHRIVQSLRTIYQSNWIGTGWSKGGMTTLFHEYFHPEDLDLAIPMVAPISFGKQDGRYPPFLAQIGTEECRQTLDQSMLGALGRLEEMLDVFGPLSVAERDYYREAIKQQVVSIDWAYWQYLGFQACDEIPDGSTASAESLVYFFLYLEIRPSVEAPRPIRPDEASLIAYSYQAATELGYQDVFPTGHLQRLVDLGYITETERLMYETPFEDRGADTPWGILPPFNSQSMIDVDEWLKNDAIDVLAVYGEYDPWTGGKISVNEANGCKVFVAPQTSHGAFLADLSADDRAEVSGRISRLGPQGLAASVRRARVPPNRGLLNSLLRQNLL